MNKKYFLMILTLSSAFIVLSGCGNSKTSISVNNNETDISESDINSNDIQDEQIFNITDENEVVIADDIDYDIKSYDSINKFSYSLFSKNIDEENPVLSPISAYLALSMAGLGADGNTRTEFLEVLGEDMTALSDDMMNTLPVNSENNIVSIANSVWIDEQFLVNDSWFKNVKSLMDADAFQCVLSTEKTKNRMNSWIEDRTNGLIDKMLSQPLEQDSKLALINTIYFKAKWNSSFDKNLTYIDKFTLSDKNMIEIEMMHKEENMEYISSDFAEGIVLPYRNWNENDGNFAFLAIKSKDSCDVRDTYNRLTNTVIKEMLVNTQTKLVNTKIPKFEITFDKVLNDSIKSMGLNQAFDATNANLTLLGSANDNSNLYINLIKQKAKIIVDEEGTEAAAATMIALECASALDESEIPLDIFFDEPFIYIIMDMDKEIPLFIGILDNPAA